jgi:hypothetical protein
MTESHSRPATALTYVPSGTPSVSGTSNGWPLLYHGMEHELTDPNQFYYSGDGAFYSAKIMRSMSMTSAQGSKTPVGDASGIVGGGGMALSGMTNAAALAAEVAFQDPTEAGEASAPSGGGGSNLFTLFDIWEWGQFFGGGGGGGLSRNQQVLQFRATRVGKHPLYPDIIGVQDMVGQASIRYIADEEGPAEEDEAETDAALQNIFEGRRP